MIPKEQYPMLANPRLDSDRGECDYTTTWQRRAMVAPAAVTRDTSLPPPPREAYESRSIASPSLHYHHPSMVYPLEQPSASFNPFHQHVDHIYESPKFDRKTYSDGPVYHELDPDKDSGDNTLDSPPDLVPDEITYGRDVLTGPGGHNWPPPPPPPPQSFPGVHGMGGVFPR